MKLTASLLVILVAIIVCFGDVVINDINLTQDESIDASAVSGKKSCCMMKWHRLQYAEYIGT
jgi:hypothetical protein